ncbi:MAG: GNAT family N-acetyltransferase [Bacteroidota bacterium]
MSTNEFSSGKLQIVNSTLADIDFIFKLFDNAIEYQKKNGYELWPLFSKQLIETEIKEKRHWKILEGNTIVCVFSVLYNDPVIWEEKDKDPSVYLHRIAINPSFKGRHITNVIKNWAIQHAMEKNKKYVRMDTWGDNENLRKYYTSCGFNYLGQQHLKAVHYGGSVLSLFQIEI